MTGLENARRLGEDMAVLAAPRLKNLPFYFPEYRTTGSRYANEHAARSTRCATSRASSSAPTGS